MRARRERRPSHDEDRNSERSGDRGADRQRTDVLRASRNSGIRRLWCEDRRERAVGRQDVSGTNDSGVVVDDDGVLALANDVFDTIRALCGDELLLERSTEDVE